MDLANYEFKKFEIPIEVTSLSFYAPNEPVKYTSGAIGTIILVGFFVLLCITGSIITLIHEKQEKKSIAISQY